MKCKAVELLEVLLEENHEDSKKIISAIAEDLNINSVTKFIENIYVNVKETAATDPNYKDYEDYKSIVQRNMFRAYHILRSIADFCDEETFDELSKS